METIPTLPLLRALAFILMLTGSALHAQVPQILNYQGRVAVGSPAVNFEGSGGFKFALVNGDGTQTYWSNDGTSNGGSEPTAAVTLPVTKGLYSVLLGDTSLGANMTAIPSTVFANPDVRLRVWFNDGTNGSQLLTPDQRIAAVGYAIMAGDVADGAITTAKIAAGAVGTSQLASNLSLSGTTTGTFSGSISGNATTATTASSAVSFTGSLGGDIIGTQGATVVSSVGGISATNVAAGAILANAATSANTASTVVRRDASGNFSAGTITANLEGSATSFTGTLGGDITGTQGATSIAATTVTGKALTGFNSAAGTITAADTILGAINKLDGNIALRAPLASPTFTGTVTAPAFSGNLQGNAATATTALSAVSSTTSNLAVNFTGSLEGEITGTQGATVVSSVGGSSAANLHAAELAANAATSSNTANSIVKRDSNGNFTAGTITAAAYNGNGSGLNGVMGAVPWVVISGTSQQAEANTGYVASNAAEVTVTLPESPEVGDIVRVTGAGEGGWKVVQKAGQRISTSILSPPGASWTARDSSRAWTCVASSSDGVKLIAGVDGGHLYTSTDSGLTWTPRDSIRSWRSVASSADGTKLVAVAANDQIFTSTDSGSTWNARNTSRNWSGVASSSNGTILVACVRNGKLYNSTDSGLTWTERLTASNFQWSSVASSSDGTKLLAAHEGSSGAIYISGDFGVNWFSPVGTHFKSWTSVATSSSGDTLVGVSDFIYTSNNGGSTWTPRIGPGSWRGVTCSSDGSKVVAVSSSNVYTSTDSGYSWAVRNGISGGASCIASSDDGTKLFAGTGSSMIYTSIPETTIGISGFISGGMFTAIELQYIGNGRFIPISAIGEIQSY